MASLPLIAGLLAPCLQTIGLFIWADRWKGTALGLNSFKGCFASLFHGAVALVTTVSFRSAYVPRAVGYMLLSSFLGIVVADTWWLVALARLGARRMIAIDAIKPFLAALFGALVLRDEIPPLGYVGVAATAVGIYLVNRERDAGEEEGDEEEEEEEEDGGGEKGGSGERREENLPSDGCLAVKEVELAMALDGNGSIGSSKSKRKGRTATLSSTTNPQWANGGEREAREEEEEARGDAHGDHGREGEGEDKAEGKSGLAVAYFYAVGNVTLDVVAATITVAEHGALTTADVNLLRFGFAGVVLTAAVVARDLCCGFGAAGEATVGEATAALPSSAAASTTTRCLQRWWYTGGMSRSDRAAVAAGVVFVTVLNPLIMTW
jgi:uncharacterized membrane protein